MKKHRICVVTGTRAEYGLLRPVIEKLFASQDFSVDLVVTGAHLEKDFGYTLKEILADVFPITASIPCVVNKDSSLGMSLSTSKALSGFAEHFSKNRPDLLMILGDRYEIFACATAAAMAQIPIAHLYGGDSTEGAVDEFFRHSITKMSQLHFVSNELSRKRVIQLGESPDRVFNVGATGIENIEKMSLLSKIELGAALNLNLDAPYAVATFHPVTMDEGNATSQIEELFSAIDACEGLNFIFTRANADTEGHVINEKIDAFVTQSKKMKSEKSYSVYDSLGTLRYLSALKYSEMIIGNSSSGIYEAPALGIPTVNIGDRQKGRLQSSSIFNCEAEKDAILKAIRDAFKFQSAFSEEINNPYRGEYPSGNIVRIIEESLQNGNLCVKKKFYDLTCTNI